MALKETIQITVDEAGLRQLQAALKKAGGEVNNFNNFLKEERTEGRKANFVINESTKSARALSAAFGGAGSGLIGNMSKAVGVFDDLGFAMSAAQVGADKMGGKMSTLAAGIGRIAIPIAVATAAWTLYSDTIDGFTKRSEEATKSLRDIQYALGEISFEEYNAQIKAELEKLVAEGKTIGNGFWQNFFNSPVVQMAGGATAQTIADLINKSVKADKDENNLAQAKGRQALGLGGISNRDALQEVELQLQNIRATANRLTESQEERVKAERTILELTKQREALLRPDAILKAIRDFQYQNSALQSDTSIIRARNEISKNPGNSLRNLTALKDIAAAEADRQTQLQSRLGEVALYADTITPKVQRIAATQASIAAEEAKKAWADAQRLLEDAQLTLASVQRAFKDKWQTPTSITGRIPEDQIKWNKEHGITIGDAASYDSDLQQIDELIRKQQEAQATADLLRRKYESLSNVEKTQTSIMLESMGMAERLAKLQVDNQRLQIQKEMATQEQSAYEASKAYLEASKAYTQGQLKEYGINIFTGAQSRNIPQQLKPISGPTPIGLRTEDMQTSFGDVFKMGFEGGEDRLDGFTQASLDAFSVIGDAGVQMWEDMFGGANSLLEQFIARFMGSLTDQVFNAGIGALLSLLPGGGLLNFFTGKYHDGGIVKAHAGMYLNAPASQEIPIIARGGEMVLTEQQQGRLFSMANGQGGSSAPVNVSLTINAMDAQSVRNTFNKKEIQRELMKAIGEATRSGRMAW